MTRFDARRARFLRPNAQLYVRPDAQRFLRPDAKRFLRQDWKRFVRPGFAPVFPSLLEGKANFDPNQPRVPKGNPDGGQWTAEGSSGESENSEALLGRIASQILAQIAGQLQGLLGQRDITLSPRKCIAICLCGPKPEKSLIRRQLGR